MTHQDQASKIPRARYAGARYARARYARARYARARYAAAAVVAALAIAGLACSSDPGSGADAASPPATSSPTEAPDVVGTWEGDYVYAYNDDDGSPLGVAATEHLVIEHQEGPLVWGVDEFLDDGELTRIPVRGSFDATFTELTLTEDGGFFTARVVGQDAMSVTFTRTDSEYTAFSATLTRR